MGDKSFYLIKQWNPCRGQTESRPSCYVGPCFSAYPPLQNVKPENCYKTRAAAERYAARLYHPKYSRTEVVEVPQAALIQLSVNATTIDAFLYEIERNLMNSYGVDTAKREMEPLRWYIETARASTPCIRKMMEAKPFMLARKLHQGGSTDEIVKRILKYIGWED